jgi:large subunit ribosomal protein L22
MATSTQKTAAPKAPQKVNVTPKTQKPAVKEAVAHIRYIHMAPQKVQRIADLVRSLDVQAAEHLLASVPKRASLPVWKAIKSAAASAVHNYELDAKKLYVRAITVGHSLELPRFMPRAQGRAYKIRKRFSHIDVIVAERPEPKKPEPKKARVKATK